MGFKVVSFRLFCITVAFVCVSSFAHPDFFHNDFNLRDEIPTDNPIRLTKVPLGVVPAEFQNLIQRLRTEFPNAEGMIAFGSRTHFTYGIPHGPIATWMCWCLSATN